MTVKTLGIPNIRIRLKTTFRVSLPPLGHGLEITSVPVQLEARTLAIRVVQLSEPETLSIDIAPTPEILDLTEQTRFTPTITVHAYPVEQFADTPINIRSYPVRLPNVRLFGMNYADKYWEEVPNPLKQEQRRTKVKGTSPLQQRTPPEDGVAPPPRKPHEPRKPSLWDLIFVLLKPPIRLDTTEDVYFPHPLFPYQIAGVEFLMGNESALLADDMGTGKTVMTIAALRILAQQAKVKRALIVCPLSVLNEWKKHLHEWAFDLVPVYVRGDKRQRSALWKSDAHVYVTTYDTLRGDIESKTFPADRHDMFDVVVLDEAHHVKNLTSGRSKAVRKLQTRQRWALTGTPVQNRIEELHALFEFLRPGYLTGYTNPQFVKQRIEPYYLRRRKQDVLADLPPKERQEIWLELDNDQRAVYDAAEMAIQDELRQLGDDVNEIIINRSVTKLKQLCNFAPNKGTSPKVTQLKEHVEQIVNAGNKVIVFSQFIGEGIDKLEKALKAYGVAKIVGDQSESERARQITIFKQSRNVNILLASVRAAGEGLNLVEANYVIHFDHWWNPAVMWQAEDRVHRRGQRLAVNVYAYWVYDTIEERIYELLEQKKLLFQQLFDADSAAITLEKAITMDEWLDILKVKQKPKAQHTPTRNISTSVSLTEIQATLKQIDPSHFEQVTQKLFQHLGLTNARVVGQAGDGGIDVEGVRHSHNGQEYIVAQCKRYQGTIGVEIAREFYGAIQHKRATKGYLVTTADFSRDCLAFCQAHAIETISGIELARYVQQFGLTL